MVPCKASALRCKTAPVQTKQAGFGRSVCLLWSRNRCGRFRTQLPTHPCEFALLRRPSRTLSVRVTAWAEAPRSVAYRNKVSGAPELRLISELLHQEELAGTTRLTLYQREADSLYEGRLQLCQAASLTIPGIESHGEQQTLDSRLSLGDVGCAASAYSAEEALAQAQLVDLPHNGGSVLPLAAHGFLVGLLVIEGFSAQEPPVSQTPELCAGCYALTRQQKDMVTLAGCVLASACAMELHSALERAGSLVHRQRVIGLVEEVRGPLTALRTLGSILVPRLRQAQGREVDRDVVQGMLTQGDRLQDLVQQLQAAIHPADRPHELKQLAQQGVLRPVNKCPDMPDRSLKQLKKLGNETRAMLPSNTHSRLESSDNK